MEENRLQLEATCKTRRIKVGCCAEMRSYEDDETVVTMKKCEEECDETLIRFVDRHGEECAEASM